MLRVILFLVATLSAASMLQGGPLRPIQIETPDRGIIAEVKAEGGLEDVVLKFTQTAAQKLIWTSPNAKQDGGVEYGKERVFKLMWSAGARGGDYYLIAVTELQRYGDVYDPHAIYAFSTETGEMLWKKVLGRRWDELVASSTESGLVATVVPVSKNAYDDAIILLDIQTGREMHKIYLSDIKRQNIPSAVGVEQIRFAKDALEIDLYGEPKKQLFTYLWHFEH